jgi:hypothetical protein
MQARPLLIEGKTEALVDPRLAADGGGGYDAEQARRLAFVASLCIRPSATWRPSMTEVRQSSAAGRMHRVPREGDDTCPCPKYSKLE